MRSSWKTSVGVMLALAGLSLDASAQEPLRWKFTLGEELDYHVVQTMTLTTSGEPLETRVTPLEQQMDMQWKVLGVRGDGEAVIGQKLRNMRLKMTGPRGEPLEYDSSREEPGGTLTALVAPIYDALSKAEFEFTMTVRGEIKDVKVPEEVLEALKTAPASSVLGDLATAEGIQRMIVSWAFVLPEEPPTPGQETRSRVTLTSAVGGRQTVESSYRFEGLKDVDGHTYAVFRPGLEITFADKDGTQTKVRQQHSSGEILFDPAAGRLQSAKLVRELTLDVTVAGQTVEEKVAQSVEATLMPAK